MATVYPDSASTRSCRANAAHRRAFTLAKLDQLFVFPMHPRTRDIVNKMQLEIPSNVHVIDPVGYYDILELESNANAVLTDSGGMQKEAYFFNKYCITMRDQTEWTELIEHGFNSLTGADRDKIIQQYRKFSGKTVDTTLALYGNGQASEKIVESILKYIQ